MTRKTLAAFFCLVVCSYADDVVMHTPTGELHGSLEVVENGCSHIVLILPGSGPTDRDGNSSMLPGKNNSLKYIAEHLSRHKIPSLRVDKRGIASSAKAMVAEKDLRIETYVDDAVSWIGFLRKKGYQKVTILGHSEGSLIGMIAAQKTRVDGYISIAGPGRPATELLTEQLTKQLPPKLLHDAKQTMAILKSGKTTGQYPSSLASLFRPSVQPYLISWFKYDPAKELAKLTQRKVPILIIHGTTDIQIPVRSAKTLHASAAESKLEIIEGMNHVLKKATQEKKSQDAAYTDPKIPLHPKIGKTIIGFIVSCVR